MDCLYAIDINGSLWSCGYNEFGACGHGDVLDKLNLSQIKHVDNIEFVSFCRCPNIYVFGRDRQGFLIALDKDGFSWLCGYNENIGLEINGVKLNGLFLEKINEDICFKSLECGQDYLVGIEASSGNLWGYGNSNLGQLDSNIKTFKNFSQIKNSENAKFVSISCGNEFLSALDENGNVWIAGCYDHHEDNISCYTHGLKKINHRNSKFKYIKCDIYLIAIDEEDVIWMLHYVPTHAYHSSYYVDDDIKSLQFQKLQICPDSHINNLFVSFVVNLGNNIVFLDADGYMWVYGENAKGQLGVGNTYPVKNLTRLNNPSNIVDVSMALDFVVAVDVDGNIWSCGSNEYDQLGIENVRSVNIFTCAQTSAFFTSVHCCTRFVIALDIDNNIWTCGINNHGQLGVGDRHNRKVFTQTQTKQKFSNINGKLKILPKIKSVQF